MEIILNGERISAQACEQEIQRLAREAPQLERSRVEASARENLIARGLLRQNAFNSGIGVSGDEVEAEYRRLVAGYGGETPFYTQMGLSKKRHEKLLKRDLQERIRVDKFVADLTADLAQPAEETVEDYCREHAAELKRPAVAQASHIVRRPEGADGGETYRAMVELRARLLAGADFADTARRESGCEDGGGDLGSFSPGRMVAEFDAVVFSMRAGEISPVFLTSFGYHIVQLREIEPERPMTHEEALAEARSRLLVRAREQRLVEWIAAKRERATVDVRP